MPNSVAKLLSTFFYVGYFPLAPGSMASIVGMLICFLLQETLLVYISFFVIVTVLGFWASAKMEDIVGEKDPSCIVIDEVSGVMLAFFLLPLTPAVVITTFFLFRAFDMFKIYPVNKFDDMKGGVGIMLDDLFAGLYTNLAMQIAVRWAGIV